MDPYDEYMKQQEEWQSEISKRDDEIRDLKIELRKRWERIEELSKEITGLKENVKFWVNQEKMWKGNERMTLREFLRTINSSYSFDYEIEDLEMYFEKKTDDPEISYLRKIDSIIIDPKNNKIILAGPEPRG